MWDIYDELIAAVPSELRVTDCLVGVCWTMVHSLSTGMAMTMDNDMGFIRGSGSLVGMRVRELAEYVKSWNNLEAGIGLAAINSAINTVERAEEYAGYQRSRQVEGSAFQAFRQELQGKKVAVIGHFPGLDELKEWCQLSILERNPQQGDLPDPACEYILPNQDYVFLTATTLINKTFPRLLELSKEAKVILVGPSTPLHPSLFERGVEVLAGSVIEEKGLWTYIREGGMGPGVFKRGCRMVEIHKSELVRA